MIIFIIKIGLYEYYCNYIYKYVKNDSGEKLGPILTK